MQVQAGDVLLDSGAQSRNVYFPATALVSLLNVTTDGASAQIAVVGVDGIVGVTNFMGGGLTTTMAVVQGRGDIYWMAARCLTDEFDRAGPAMRLLLRYTQALMSQIAQTTVCNRHHSVEQRLCRCLLLNLDRLPRVDKMMMSQHLLVGLLGVGRGGISKAAQRLQEAGVIRYARGQMTVSDRGGLEARVCECYGVVRRECDRLRSYAVS